MKPLTNLFRVLLVLSVTLSACAPLSGDTQTPTAPPATATAGTATGAPTAVSDTAAESRAPTSPADETSEEEIETTATLAATVTTAAVEPTATVRQDDASSRTDSSPIPPAAKLPLGEPVSIVETIPPPESYDEALERIDDFMFRVEELRAEIDRTQFDVTELGFALGFEAESMINFVRDEIYFEQYPGVLRGAQGTLMSRAGNAMDQAVLLATLLGDAGFETRVARGTISKADAEVLIMQMAEPRPPAPPVGDETTMTKIVSELHGAAAAAAVPGVDMDALFEMPTVENTPAYQDAQANAEFIRGRLDAAGVSLGTDSTLDDIIAEAQEYAWVEYRLGPTDEWLPAHPAFADEDAAPDVAADERYNGSIPQELQHRFRMQVFIEQKTGDNLTTTPVMDAWERPVANMAGVNLTFYNHPSGLYSPSGMTDTQKISEETHFFMPMFNGSLAPGARYFDLNGIALDPAAVGMDSFGMTAFFQTTGDKVEDATSALDSIGSDEEETDSRDDFRTLTGQWIEYTFIAPDGEETTHRRWVLDRIGAENRAAGTVAMRDDEPDSYDPTWALATYHSFMVAPGTYPAAYALDRQLERVLKLRPMLELLVERSFDPGVELSLPKEDLEGLQAAPALNVFTAFDMIGATQDDLVTYRDAPSLVVYREGISPDQTRNVARMGIDVVTNSRRTFRQINGELAPAPEASVLLGTWETRMERVGLPAGAENQIYRFDTQIAFQEARAADIAVRVLRPNDLSRLQQLALSADARRYLERDLSSGYAVVVPEQMAPDSEDTGWWRIDPDTGETLGMTSSGGGDEFTEYLATLSAVSAAFAAFFGFMGFLICMSPDSDCSLVECALTTIAGAAIGAGIGFAVGAIILASMLSFGAAAAVAETTAFGVEMAINGILLVALPACVEGY